MFKEKLVCSAANGQRCDNVVCVQWSKTAQQSDTLRYAGQRLVSALQECSHTSTDDVWWEMQAQDCKTLFCAIQNLQQDNLIVPTRSFTKTISKLREKGLLTPELENIVSNIRTSECPSPCPFSKKPDLF